MADEHPSPVEVIVKLTPAAVTPDSPQDRSVRALMTELDSSLEPLHPSASDDELATYYVAHVEPDALAGALERLAECDGVDGAYAKPRGEAPDRTP